MRCLKFVVVSGLLIMANPALAEQGKLKVHRSTDSNGNSVIVIHETRPEVLARQRVQVQQAQNDRRQQKERELRLEIERLRAERDLVEAQARREAARRADAVGPGMAYGRTYSQPKARASFFNGGLGPLGGISLGPWGGGFGGFRGGFHSMGSIPPVGGFPRGGFQGGFQGGFISPGWSVDCR